MQGRHISAAQPRPTQLRTSDNVGGSSQAPTLADRQITASPTIASAAQSAASPSPSVLAATNQRLPTELSATAKQKTAASISDAAILNTMRNRKTPLVGYTELSYANQITVINRAEGIAQSKGLDNPRWKTTNLNSTTLNKLTPERKELLCAAISDTRDALLENRIPHGFEKLQPTDKRRVINASNSLMKMNDYPKPRFYVFANIQITAPPSNASAAQATASASPSTLDATNQRLPTEVSATSEKKTAASISNDAILNTLRNIKIPLVDFTELSFESQQSVIKRAKRIAAKNRMEAPSWAPTQLNLRDTAKYTPERKALLGATIADLKDALKNKRSPQGFANLHPKDQQMVFVRAEAMAKINGGIEPKFTALSTTRLEPLNIDINSIAKALENKTYPPGFETFAADIQYAYVVKSKIIAKTMHLPDPVWHPTKTKHDVLKTMSTEVRQCYEAVTADIESALLGNRKPARFDELKPPYIERVINIANAVAKIKGLATPDMKVWAPDGIPQNKTDLSIIQAIKNNTMPAGFENLGYGRQLGIIKAYKAILEESNTEGPAWYPTTVNPKTLKIMSQDVRESFNTVNLDIRPALSGKREPVNLRQLPPRQQQHIHQISQSIARIDKCDQPEWKPDPINTAAPNRKKSRAQPTSNPTAASASASASAPATTLAHAPAPAPATTPVPVPATTPAHAPATTPAHAPATTPEQAAAQAAASIYAAQLLRKQRESAIQPEALLNPSNLGGSPDALNDDHLDFDLLADAFPASNQQQVAAPPDPFLSEPLNDQLINNSMDVEPPELNNDDAVDNPVQPPPAKKQRTAEPSNSATPTGASAQPQPQPQAQAATPLQAPLAAAASAVQPNISSEIDTAHIQWTQNSDTVTDSLADGLPFDPKDFDALLNSDEPL